MSTLIRIRPPLPEYSSKTAAPLLCRTMKLGQTSIVHFLSRFLSSVLGFFATIYFARILGADALGTYSLVVGLVAWLGLAAEIGVSSAIKKRVSEGTDESAYAIAGVSLIALLFLGIAVGVFLFSDIVDDYVGYPAAGFVVLMLFGSLAVSVVSNLLEGQKRVHVAGILGPIRTGARSALQIGAVFVGLQIGGFFMGYAAGYLFAAVIGCYLLLRTFEDVHLPDAHHYRRLVSYAKYSWLGGLRSKAFNWVDILLLGIFVPSSLVGIYSAAWNIAMFLILFGGSLSQTLFPEMSERAANSGSQTVADLLDAALAYAGLFLIPGLVGGALLGDRLLTIYGDEFSQGGLVLTILIAAALIQGYQRQLTNTLNAIDRPELAFRVNAVFISGNVVLNLVLIYLYGWIGAAVATTVSVAISLIVAYYVLSAIIDFAAPFAEIGRQWIAAGLMGTFIYSTIRIEDQYSVFDHELVTVLLLVGIGAGIYFTSLFVISPRFRTTVRENVPFRLPINA